MKTLYIDVYFLINFTVDILSLYFAALFSKIPTSTRRLVISSLIGAIISIIIVFLPEITLIKLIASAFGLFIMGYITPRSVSIRRRIKFIFAFIIFTALCGGAVTFIWSFFDQYLSSFLADANGGAVNRKMLLLSIILLLTIGVFKMLVSFFSSNESEGSVELEITFSDNIIKLSAFIDSGNLAVDPMDMTPVLFIKETSAEEILPKNIINLSDIDSLDRDIKKRIRLIPITRNGETHMIVGVKADSVCVVYGDKKEEIRVTIAVDKEGGTFSGFNALMPSAALDNVVI